MNSRTPGRGRPMFVSRDPGVSCSDLLSINFMTDKEILDWMDKNRRGVWWNKQSNYWSVQEKQSVPTNDAPIRTVIEAVFNSEPVTDS